MKVHSLLLQRAAEETSKKENKSYSSVWSFFDPVLAGVALAYLLLPVIFAVGRFLVELFG